MVQLLINGCTLALCWQTFSPLKTLVGQKLKLKAIEITGAKSFLRVDLGSFRVTHAYIEPSTYPDAS